MGLDENTLHKIKQNKPRACSVYSRMHVQYTYTYSAQMPRTIAEGGMTVGGWVKVDERDGSSYS